MARAKKRTLKKVGYVWALVVAFNAGFAALVGPDLLGGIFGFIRLLPDLIDVVGMLFVLYLAYLALTE